LQISTFVGLKDDQAKFCSKWLLCISLDSSGCMHCTDTQQMDLGLQAPHVRHSEKISMTHILRNKQHSFPFECQLFLLP